MGRKGVNMFKRRGRQASGAIAAAEHMPSMKWLDAAVWLSSNRQVRCMVFNAAKAAGVIVYDPAAECWKGRSGVAQPDINRIVAAETGKDMKDE